MAVRFPASVTEQTGDRQTLAIQTNAKPTREAVKQLLIQTQTITALPLVASETAALVGSTRALYIANTSFRLVRAYLLSRGTLTTSDANYATISLQAGGFTGTQRRELASFTTKTTGGQGNWTVASILVFGITSQDIAAGEALFFRTAKAGTGVIVPACAIQFDVVPR